MQIGIRKMGLGKCYDEAINLALEGKVRLVLMLQKSCDMIASLLDFFK